MLERALQPQELGVEPGAVALFSENEGHLCTWEEASDRVKNEYRNKVRSCLQAYPGIKVK